MNEKDNRFLKYCVFETGKYSRWLSLLVYWPSKSSEEDFESKFRGGLNLL